MPTHSNISPFPLLLIIVTLSSNTVVYTIIIEYILVHFHY